MLFALLCPLAALYIASISNTELLVPSVCFRCGGTTEEGSVELVMEIVLIDGGLIDASSSMLRFQWKNGWNALSTIMY